jgi:hypothetical protein
VFANEIDSARGHDQDVGWLAAIGLREESAGLFGHAGVHGAVTNLFAVFFRVTKAKLIEDSAKSSKEPSIFH